MPCLVSLSPFVCRAARMVSRYTSFEWRCCCWLSEDWLSSVLVPSRRRRHYHDDDALSSLSSTSSRDTSLPGGGQSQSLVRLPAENDVVPSVGFAPDIDR